MADFCVYWFRKAHDHLAARGRAGLVGTQNIRNNASRVGSLDYITANGGTITEAVSAQVWSGDAAVHVSIVNWIKGEELGPKMFFTQKGDSVASPWITTELPRIGPTLSADFDVSSASALAANTKPQCCFNGQMVGPANFLISEEQRAEMIHQDSKSADVLYPYLSGADVLSGAKLDRYVIDFEQLSRFDAEAYHHPFDWVRQSVLPDRAKKAEKGDFRYSAEFVYDTFPWPQSPTRKQIEVVAKEAVALRQLRREVMTNMNWSLRDLYRTLGEPGSNTLRACAST